MIWKGGFITCEYDICEKANEKHQNTDFLMNGEVDYDQAIYSLWW